MALRSGGICVFSCESEIQSKANRNLELNDLAVLLSLALLEWPLRWKT